jgi:ABC-type multidrug transport system fused ATPase/permease subunit
LTVPAVVGLAIVKALLTFVPAYLLSQIIRSLEVEETDRPYQISLCLGLAVSSALSGTLASQASYWEMASISKPVHFQLRTLLFEKTLRRKDVVPTGQNGQAGGKTQVMNLFTLDVPRIAGLGADLANVSTALVDLVIGTCLLYSLLGWSSLLGLALNAVTIPFNKLLADFTFDVDHRRSLARDERISAVDEVLAGIRGVKFEAGEDYWEARIEELRRQEVRLQRVRYTLGTLYNLIWCVSFFARAAMRAPTLTCLDDLIARRGSLPVLAILVSLTSFALLAGGELTPHVAFPALAIFNGLQLVWTAVPSTMTRLVEAGVSLRRLAAYLGSSEVDGANCLPNAAPTPLLIDVRERFELSDVSFAYPLDRALDRPPVADGSFRLRGLSLGLQVGKLNLVVGPVAAGKSLLLLGLLGEADQPEGRHNFPRSAEAAASVAGDAVPGPGWLIEGTAYVPQSSWLQNTSVRGRSLWSH